MPHTYTCKGMGRQACIGVAGILGSFIPNSAVNREQLLWGLHGAPQAASRPHAKNVILVSIYNLCHLESPTQPSTKAQHCVFGILFSYPSVTTTKAGGVANILLFSSDLPPNRRQPRTLKSGRSRGCRKQGRRQLPRGRCQKGGASHVARGTLAWGAGSHAVPGPRMTQLQDNTGGF